MSEVRFTGLDEIAPSRRRAVEELASLKPGVPLAEDLATQTAQLVMTTDVSQAIGERVLLPAVRSAPSDTLVVSDGFSCREQIAQSTDRRALHLAELLRMAIPP